MEEAQSYWRHVYHIMVGAHVELTANVEAQLKQQQHDAQVFVDTVASNAPAGSEAAVNALQTAVTAASEATSATIEASKKPPNRRGRLRRSALAPQLPPQTGRPDTPPNRSRPPRKNKRPSTRLSMLETARLSCFRLRGHFGKGMRSLPGSSSNLSRVQASPRRQPAAVDAHSRTL
jgi:hypothetical protein